MPMDDAELWRQWLTDRMAEAGLDTAGFIARSEGRFNSKMVSRWLRGDVCPSAETALLVAKILGVPESEALGASSHLKVAGAVARLASTDADSASSEPVQTILGFEHLAQEQQAAFVEMYRQHIEAVKERIQARIDGEPDPGQD